MQSFGTRTGHVSNCAFPLNDIHYNFVHECGYYDLKRVGNEMCKGHGLSDVQVLSETIQRTIWLWMPAFTVHTNFNQTRKWFVWEIFQEESGRF
jgi:hypothetical protein